MRKTLILTFAIVFVLAIATTAFAANPFTDVPVNHWAYASVSELAKNGVIDGYGDGTYMGSKAMTRYEMAQIVAKAMAKSDQVDAAQKAQIEKLAAEFSEELDSLGVRVAKLEKNADNVRFTGDIRIGNWSYDKSFAESGVPGAKSRSEMRSRIWLTGEVNDRWSYIGMFENTQNLQTNDREGTVHLRRAWVDGNIGELQVRAGRFYWLMVYGTVLDDDADGLVLSYQKNDFTMHAFALRPVFTNKSLQNYGAILDKDPVTGEDIDSNNQVYGAIIANDFNKLKVQAAYYHTSPSMKKGKNVSIYELALGYRFDKNWNIWGEYLHGSKNVADGGKNGWAARLDYGQVMRNKPGSYNINFAYYDLPASTTFNPATEFKPYDNGYKGYVASATVMLAKNIDFNVQYFDFEDQKGKRDNDLLWTYMRFYF